jgi:uncharacterized protein with von Willebrand factor type A (vWA) domain
MNPASQLGKLAASVPKKYSAAEIAKRTARLREAQKTRAKQQRSARRSNKSSQATASGDDPSKPK